MLQGVIATQACDAITALNPTRIPSMETDSTMIMAADQSMGIATALYDRGYQDLVSVIPPDAHLSPRSDISESQRGKCPGKKREDGWVGYPFTYDRPSRADTLMWGKWGANVGLLGEAHPALDIDSDDQDLTETVLELAREHLGQAPVRRSRGSRRLLAYRTDEPFKGRALRVVVDRKPHTIEFLGMGQQFVVAGGHPSGQQYRWEGTPLWEVNPWDLPTISRAQADDFLEKLQAALEAQGASCTRTRGRTRGAEVKAVPQEDLRAPSLERLEEVVSQIPNTSEMFPHRADYIKVGYAIKAAGGDEALWIFLEWCNRWDGGFNDPDTVEADWRGMNPPFRVGYSWLLQLAGLNDADLHFTFEDPPDGVPAAPTNPRVAALRELNETYAVVQVGSQVRILQEQCDDIALLRADDFKLLLKNRRVPSSSDAGATQLLANAWLEWPKRRQYDRIVFRPGEKHLPPTEYNRWRGWNVEPSGEGTCDRFLEHLHDIICCGDGPAYDWLLDWLAHVFQHPQEKPGIVVAIRGRQGAGKSIVGAVLKKLLGRHHVIAEKADHVVGRFNAHLEHCLVLQCEEAFWGGSKQAAGALKHLVTGEQLPIERKFADVREVTNFTRVLITSNEDWVWPTSIDDRRLVVFDASNERVKDHRYFQAMLDELESGGCGKLLHTLLTREIDFERLQNPPRTAALAAQSAESMSSEENWLLSFLQEGEIDGTIESDGSALTTMDALFTSYSTSLSSRAYRKNKNAFGQWIKSHLCPEKVGRPRTRSTRTTLYRLPPLSELRERYSSRGRGANQEWDEPHGWVAAELFLDSWVPLSEAQNG